MLVVKFHKIKVTCWGVVCQKKKKNITRHGVIDSRLLCCIGRRWRLIRPVSAAASVASQLGLSVGGPVVVVHWFVACANMCGVCDMLVHDATQPVSYNRSSRAPTRNWRDICSLEYQHSALPVCRLQQMPSISPTCLGACGTLLGASICFISVLFLTSNEQHIYIYSFSSVPALLIFQRCCLYLYILATGSSASPHLACCHQPRCVLVRKKRLYSSNPTKTAHYEVGVIHREDCAGGASRPPWSFLSGEAAYGVAFCL